MNIPGMLRLLQNNDSCQGCHFHKGDNGPCPENGDKDLTCIDRSRTRVSGYRWYHYVEDTPENRVIYMIQRLTS